MADSLNWGIIGCGNVVEKKSGPSILMAGHSRIVAVMRRDVAKARPFAEAHRIPLCTANAAEVINRPEVDIIYVATPPSSHKEYVLAAARAGKHVLVEKPMGLSAAEDTEMIAACEQAGIELFVAYYRRFHLHVLKMKELVDSGRIGYPVMAQIDFAQPPIPGFNCGCHQHFDVGLVHGQGLRGAHSTRGTVPRTPRQLAQHAVRPMTIIVPPPATHKFGLSRVPDHSTPPLLIPPHRPRPHQPAERQPVRLVTADDGLDDVRCQAGQA